MQKSFDFMIAVECRAFNEKWEKFNHFACFLAQFTYIKVSRENMIRINLEFFRKLEKKSLSFGKSFGVKVGFFI